MPDQQLPELWDTAGVAAYLKVSDARVRQLRQRPDFPDTVYWLNNGHVWLAEQIRVFDQGWDRGLRPGRPRKRR